MNKNVRWLTFGALVRAFGSSMIYPFLALYLRNVLGVSYIEIGLVIVVVSVVPLVASPFSGMLADRVGRRILFLGSLGAEAACIFLVGVSMEYQAFAPVIVLLAISNLASGALAQPAFSAYVADLTEVEERAKAFTWIRVGFNGGFSVGVVVGGALVGFIGYPWVAVIASTFLGGSTALMLRVLEHSPYDIMLAERKDGGRIGEETRRVSVRDSFLVLLRDRVFLLFCLASFVAGLTEGQWNTTLPLFINTVLGIPLWLMGVALSINGVVVTLGQFPITRFATGHRHTTSAMAGVSFYAAAFILLGAFSLLAPGLDVPIVFISIFILTLGENFSAIPNMTLPSNLAPSTEIGSYNGAFNTVGLGYVLAPSLGGASLSLTGNTLLIWTLVCLPAIPAVLLTYAVSLRVPKAPNTI